MAGVCPQCTGLVPELMSVQQLVIWIDEHPTCEAHKAARSRADARQVTSVPVESVRHYLDAYGQGLHSAQEMARNLYDLCDRAEHHP